MTLKSRLNVSIPVTLHLRVNHAHTGIVRGAASFCLDWAYAQTLNLRIDTYSDNIPMQKLLEKCGFEYCGSFERLGMDKWMAYQKI